jgi:hypothetical protein
MLPVALGLETRHERAERRRDLADEAELDRRPAAASVKPLRLSPTTP